MSNFSSLYAQCYDLLYADKDYKGEADYIHFLLNEFANDTKTILNLGCGTGNHDFLLAEKGYNIHGVDVSENMVVQANERVKKLGVNETLSFSVGDIRKVRLRKTFNAAISLFHVMSYQTSNDDLQNVFLTAKEHLKSGGVFVFDCWYGPGVLTDPPTVRVKRLENDTIKLSRIAEPVHHVQQNIIDVNYELQITSKITNEQEVLHETHRMRYLFDTEIEWLSEKYSFKKIAAYQWLTQNQPGTNTWNAVYVCKLS